MSVHYTVASDRLKEIILSGKPEGVVQYDEVARQAYLECDEIVFLTEPIFAVQFYRKKELMVTFTVVEGDRMNGDFLIPFNLW